MPKISINFIFCTPNPFKNSSERQLSAWKKHFLGCCAQHKTVQCAWLNFAASISATRNFWVFFIIPKGSCVICMHNLARLLVTSTPYGGYSCIIFFRKLFFVNQQSLPYIAFHVIYILTLLHVIDNEIKWKFWIKTRQLLFRSTKCCFGLFLIYVY